MASIAEIYGGLVRSMVWHDRVEAEAVQTITTFGQLVDGQSTETVKAPSKDIELLKHWLTPRQLADFTDFGCFDVIGNVTGFRYRITNASIFNVHRGEWAYCVVPNPYDSAGIGDVMLAQKIAIETDEAMALSRANLRSRKQSYPAAGV